MSYSLAGERWIRRFVNSQSSVVTFEIKFKQMEDYPEIDSMAMAMALGTEAEAEAEGNVDEGSD